METGMLYIVATPIGNLQDITLRALETLKKVDVIYAEDTRRTKQLLSSFEIEKLVISLHEHSSEEQLAQVVRALTGGQSVAYVTDAGTPGIQDPGGKLVAYVRENSTSVIVPLPGASAVTTLLSVAGFPTNEFRFAGYVPTKKGRQTFVKNILDANEAVVFFETAPRFLKLLDQLIEFGGAARVLVVGRELTKKFEQIAHGTPEALKVDFQEPKGEFVVALAPKDWQ